MDLQGKWRWPGFWLLGLCLGWALVPDRARGDEPTPSEREFFEKKIRPVLLQHCGECHSAAKKTRGGLNLDTREGWAEGGDSGAAIEPGKPEESLLIEAIRYAGDLQMPPKGKLPDSVIRDFEQWVARGAFDPRTGAVTTPRPAGFDLAAARQHWAYQPPRRHPLPVVQNAEWPVNDIDLFVLARLEAAGLQPAGDADRVTLARRLYFDLIGLPPTPAQIDEFVNDSSPTAYEDLADRLLASPHFGERWGRHWLDVVRYAESLTLRGFVFPDAWRYRDYVIDTFNEDRPFDRFVQEQVAGDLLPGNSLEARQRNLIATSFLVMGNSNLEEQDKQQLRMDVVDEQLDTLGKAFLAQTIGCARCHDHKFDPIPTRDYYALAGILRSTRTLEHANVSKWLELPLPVEAEREAIFQQHEAQVAALQGRLKEAKDALALVQGRAKTAGPAIIAVKDLPGVVVDDTQAKKVGEWQLSTHSARFIGDGYAHDQDRSKGDKTLTFLPELPRAGKYEVRFAYTPGDNRSMDVPLTVFSADGEQTIRVNERAVPPIDGRFISLGQHRFEANGQGFVIVATEGTRGHVIADAMQFIPVDELNAPIAQVAASKEATVTLAANTDAKAEELQAKTAAVKELEAELKRLNDTGPKRPLVMSVREEAEVGDTRVHVRGSVHNQGDEVPRGFLQVATYGDVPGISAGQSGRRELGAWLSSRENPLTARVLVNRAWHWLFGAGLVRTTDNFGAVGESPSHPELLDRLALQFMDRGWSVKQLVREMVLSRTYRLSSAVNPPGQARDPENRLLWRMNRRRLDAESLRDTMLCVSGGLQLDIGGPTIKPGTAADYGYKHIETRRSVYLPVFRNALPELLEAFDFADPSMVMGTRNVSTVAPQALFLMNHPFVLEQAEKGAARLLAEEHADDASRVRAAFRLVLGRLPTDAELYLGLRYLPASADTATPQQRLTAWAELFQTLFASVDFRYVN